MFLMQGNNKSMASKPPKVTQNIASKFKCIKFLKADKSQFSIENLHVNLDLLYSILYLEADG